MKLPRRRFLHMAAGAAALHAVPRTASAQAYPTKPIRWIIGFPAGGGADTVARIMEPWLSRQLGQPVIIRLARHVSASGTERTCQPMCLRSAYRGGADTARASALVCL